MLTIVSTDNTVRLVKMNQIDGEYIALGRQTRETGLSLTQFGLAQNNAFNVSGSGIQENEFTDGFRMSVRSTQPMIVNTNVVNGISSTMLAALPPGTQSVSEYNKNLCYEMDILTIRRQLSLSRKHQLRWCCSQYQPHGCRRSSTQYVNCLMEWESFTNTR